MVSVMQPYMVSFDGVFDSVFDEESFDVPLDLAQNPITITRKAKLHHDIFSRDLAGHRELQELYR